MQRLRPKLQSIPGIKVYLQNLPTIRLGGVLTKSQYQFTLQDSDADELYHWAPIIEEKIRALPGFQDVTSDLQIKNPQVVARASTATRPRRWASPRSRSRTPSTTPTASARCRPSTRRPTNTGSFWSCCPQYQLDPSALSMLYVRSSAGNLVPLGAVAKMTPAVGPLIVSHLGQLPAVTISFNLKPGVALGQGIEEINQADGRSACSRHPEHQLPGLGAGVPVIAVRHGPLADPGGLRDLPDPGHSVRELHPSAHHSCPGCRRPGSARC